MLFITPTSGGPRCKFLVHIMLFLLRTESTLAITFPTFELYKLMGGFYVCFLEYEFGGTFIDTELSRETSSRRSMTAKLPGTAGRESDGTRRLRPSSTLCKTPAKLRGTSPAHRWFHWRFCDLPPTSAISSRGQYQDFTWVLSLENSFGIGLVTHQPAG